MFRTVKQVEIELANLPIFREVDRIKNGDFRICVDAQFPNGEYLDIFLSQVEGCYLLHDFGEVYEYFAQTGREFPTEKDAERIEFIRNAHGVLMTTNGFELVGKNQLGKDLTHFALAFEKFFKFETMN